VLYVTGGQLTAYEWRGGQLAEAFLFHQDEEGLSDFASYLEEASWVPAHLLLDVVEEEYRRDTVPHVLGRDRNSIVRHRAARLFREVSFWTARFQGREPEGRRDDRVLFLALSNPEVLIPWLERIHEHKVPLAGIHSLPLVSERLVPVLDPEHRQVLVMSLQTGGNLRQSYFVDGQLKLSRLARMPGREPRELREAIVDEAEKLRRYLYSLRLLAREDALHAHILATGPLREALANGPCGAPDLHCHVTDLADVAARVGMNPAFLSPYADPLFAHLLMRRRTPNHYARSEDTRYSRFYRARNAMFAASAAIALVGVAWAGLQMVDGFIYKQRAVATSQQADYYEARYREARKDLPELPAEPRNLKLAVDAVRELLAKRVEPTAALQRLSAGLAEYAQVRLESVRWAHGDGKPVERSPYATAPPPSPPPEVQHLVVRAQVDPFDGDYRAVLEMLSALQARLEAVPGVASVSLDSVPLDTSPTAPLQGDALAERRRAEAPFALTIVLGGADDEKA
jgi:hypothetical protein